MAKKSYSDNLETTSEIIFLFVIVAMIVAAFYALYKLYSVVGEAVQNAAEGSKLIASGLESGGTQDSNLKTIINPPNYNAMFGLGGNTIFDWGVQGAINKANETNQ